MTVILDDIACLLADSNFRGSAWLKSLSEPIWAPENAQRTWYEWYGQFVNLLYRISFIGLAKGPQARPRYSYEETDRIIHTSDLPETIYYVIHPAFHKALDINERAI